MYKHILVPTDLTAISSHAMRVAVELASAHGARMTLVYVFPEFNAPMMSQYFPSDFEKRTQAEADKRLTEYLASQDLRGVSCDVKVRQGRVYEQVVGLADEQKIDLIVVATHSPHGLEHFLIGSNAEKIVRHARCSVLVVRPGT